MMVIFDIQFAVEMERQWPHTPQLDLRRSGAVVLKCNIGGQLGMGRLKGRDDDDDSRYFNVGRVDMC